MRTPLMSTVHALLLCRFASRVTDGSGDAIETLRRNEAVDVTSNHNAEAASRRLHKHHKRRHENLEEPPPDYADYSCDEINEIESRHASSSSQGFDRCQFAKTCNGGDGILFPRLFCSEDSTVTSTSTSNNSSGGTWRERHIKVFESVTRILLILGLSLVLLLLFRLLNSTTDEFFSPGLELFSLHLGLPPRFAGVTLLALGNGAPDVAATMNAMLQDEKNGYLLAMGELTGTTMFVSAVILGFIVRLGSGSAGTLGINEKEKEESNRMIGVPCKGPFLRDIAVLCLVTVVSMSYFHQGVIDYVFVHSMLGIYVVYVLLVLGADAYHIFYHLPRLAKKDEDETEDSSEEQILSVEYGKWKSEQSNGGTAIYHVKSNAENVQADECTPLTHLSSRSDETRTRKHRHKPHNHTLGDTMIEAISNYSCHENYNTSSGECGEEDNKAEQTAPTQSFDSKHIPPSSNLTGWGPKSADGTEALVTFHPHHAIHPHHDKSQVLFRRASSDNTGVVRTFSHEESWESTDHKQVTSATQQHDDMNNNAAVCIDQRSDSQNIITRPSSWREAWHSNVREWNNHWIDFFRDIYQNREISNLEVILLSVELPFTIVRKLTNPVPCDGYYCRPIVAASLALSPIWIYFYFNDQFGVDIFDSYTGFLLVISNVIIAALILRYAPDGEGPMDFIAVIPMTLYGFAIAATWLDSIADKLVELLELFGILLRIPDTIMGVTVLAFGNSLQDLVANVSLSKKGLNTMALTACLAGPIFNMCVGLGGGFWVLLKSTGRDEIHVKFPTNLKTGFYFTIANCALIVLAGTVFGRGVIGRGYGYIACALYAVYVLTSLLV